MPKSDKDKNALERVKGQSVAPSLGLARSFSNSDVAPGKNYNSIMSNASKVDGASKIKEYELRMSEYQTQITDYELKNLELETKVYVNF